MRLNQLGTVNRGRLFRLDPERRLVLVKFLGLSGFALAVLHSLMSMAMLGPAYYPQLFGESKMNLVGELTVVFGVLSLFWLVSPALTSLPNMQEALGDRLWKRSQRTGYIALALAAAHCLSMGLEGWLEPATWPGSMPPITLLSFVIVVLPLAAKLLSRRRGNGTAVVSPGYRSAPVRTRADESDTLMT